MNNETPHSGSILPAPNAQGDSFDVIRVIDRGGLELKLGDAMAEASQASVRTGKKSKVVITLTFDPDEKTDAMRVSGGVKTTLPPEPEKAALFFVTPEGKLTRQDFRQPRIFQSEESREG